MPQNDFSVSMFDNSTLPFCVIRVELDESGNAVDWTFLYCNDALASLEGHPKEELLQHRFFDLFPNGDRKWLKPYYEAAYNKKPMDFDSISKEIGQYLHIDCIPMEQPGLCACILRNIMAEEEYKKGLEQSASDANRANRAKTDFLRRMSHDLRTPINGIMGMLHIAERHTDDPARIHDCVEKTLAAAQQLLTLVNDVLDISKLESDEIIVENKPFDLVPLLLDELDSLRIYAAQHGITVLGGKDASQFEHRHLIGSAPLLNRILMNLSNNAVKYNLPGGSIKLTCNELYSTDDMAMFQFTCEDTGIGMSREFQKHAFEPYAQEGKPSNTSFTGTGLGLSIVQKVVAQMGGTIDLESKEGVGSKFIVTLPFGIDRAKDDASAETSSGCDVDISGQTVLLVEDNELNREIAEALLEELGVNTVSASDGLEAVRCFCGSAPGTFDCIFMDVMMPVMDGLEATRAIRALDRPDARTVPIFAISANAFQDDVHRSIAAGMNAHLTKPMEIDKIRRIMQEYTLAKQAGIDYMSPSFRRMQKFE